MKKMTSSNTVSSWNEGQVAKWLQDNGFKEYVSIFKRHKIDGYVLITLKESDLRSPPLEIPCLGDIKKISKCIDILLQSENHGSLNINKLCDYQTEGRRTNRVNSTDSNDSVDSLGQGLFEPELWKTAISFIYCFIVMLFTSFVMVIVHDRVPDRRTYPPLPDVVLDHLPMIPWAFDLAELCASFMMFIWIIILFFHKHRFILLRRMFSLSGTIFLLRCCTMLMTSLSVPGEHLHCNPRSYTTREQKMKRTVEIMTGLGMSMQGVRSCGDYMFSGHTCVLTMLNFFITEYSPRGMTTLHTVTWLLNMFGIFFILAAHEHYSIDVFIAFYITSRLFLYYHILANSRSLKSPDYKRTRTWFPMFAFFEGQCLGIVPNEYAWPLPWPELFVNYYRKKRH